MWTLTGFADEISPDVDEQIALLKTLGIRHIEFRSAWGTKVLDLTDEQLETAKQKLDAAGIALSSVGSDLGKIAITDPFEPHLARVRHGVDVAKFFDARYLRVFSFFMPDGEDPTSYRDDVLARTRAMVQIAEAGGITLLHKNEKDIFGDLPRRVADLVTTIGSPKYRAICDPANYVQCGVKPFDEAYPIVRELTDYVHCKDALAPTGASDLGKVVPSGEGDGQFRELLAALQETGFDGFFSIEPHLGDFDAFGGLCGPDLWTTAHTAITGLFGHLGVQWQ